MGLVSVLLKNPLLFILIAVPLLYSIIIHEIAHGWVAYLFGDTTAKRLGRLSFSPIPHIDPLGLLALFLVGFGWARPVPVDYRNFRNFRAGLVCVSLAGCLANILIATIAAFLLQFKFFASSDYLQTALVIIMRINIILAALNLIPIPPLDGSKILMAFLPRDAQMSLARIEPYGFFIIIFLLITRLLYPVIALFQKIILGIISFLVNIFF